MSAKKKHTTIKLIAKNKDAYILAAPFLLLFLAFTVIPAAMALVFSFFNRDMTELSGFDNFRALFDSDGVFLTALGNSALIFLAAGLGGLVLSLLIAWGFEFLNKKAADIFTAVLFVLSLTGTAVAAVWLSGGLRAPLNALLLSAGISDVPSDWLSDKDHTLLCVIISQLWTSFGLGFLALRSGFRVASRERVDAARLEGVKNPFWTLFHAQLPSVYPELGFAAVLQIPYAFTNSELLRILSGTSVEDFGAYGIITYIFEQGERLDAGKAFAANLVLIALMTAIYAGVRILISKLSKSV